ncbi:hypothetical protein C7M84_019155 [Penaeus vannamei]|uniref:Uncharacterized protein n=1 Tax=Penaeus vannamei TaxID=6689 RepID=A0A3R7MJ06_PENVA|nr:hypothetical protein C7M84_019155 [Penaeus vannamei]
MLEKRMNSRWASSPLSRLLPFVGAGRVQIESFLGYWDRRFSCCAAARSSTLWNGRTRPGTTLQVRPGPRARPQRRLRRRRRPRQAPPTMPNWSLLDALYGPRHETHAGGNKMTHDEGHETRHDEGHKKHGEGHKKYDEGHKTTHDEGHKTTRDEGHDRRHRPKANSDLVIRIPKTEASDLIVQILHGLDRIRRRGPYRHSVEGGLPARSGRGRRVA